MTLQNSRTSNATFTQFSGGERPSKGFAVVYSVIMDEKHPLIANGKENITLIGAIQFRYADQSATDDDNLPIAYPYDKNFRNIPVRNETVEVMSSDTGQLFYRRIGLELSPNVNANENYISTYHKPTEVKTSSDYGKTSSTGITKNNSSTSTKFNGYGDYFKPQTVHKLKLYEGDSIFESRFGQSLRFSGYNNADAKFYPTIILRNGENATSIKKKATEVTEEDINRDGSIIMMSSDKYKMPFQPGTIDDGGTTDFDTKPTSFKDYPSELEGNQLLLSSGRVIISSKNAEMMFYAKKNYGFISDGQLSIDNKLGIEVNVGDDINIVTNDRDINLTTNKGKVNIGSTNLEPLVKGDKWKEIMDELIDAITQQVFLTPAGPSATGPVNLPKFNEIKAKLKTALSDLNTTS